MQNSDAGLIFAKISQLWPDWKPNEPEQQEWLRVILKIEDMAIAEKAVSQYYETGAKYKRPTLPDFLSIARKLWREYKAEHRELIEPVLLYTIAREKAEPGHVQVGHQYYGKPNADFQAIEQSAQKALINEKQAYGGEWIIVYPPEKSDFEQKYNI